MSAPAAFTDGHDTHRPPCLGPTYDQLWAQYHEGRLSTSVLISLMKSDEVFAAYCKRMVRAMRAMRDDAVRSAW